MASPLHLLSLLLLLLVLLLPDVHATFGHHRLRGHHHHLGHYRHHFGSHRHHHVRGMGRHHAILHRPPAKAKIHRPKFKPGPWISAHATFYGGSDASGTKGGTCGYGDNNSKGYGQLTAAISADLFNNGLTCGACYEIKCAENNQWCKLGQSLCVTATNLSPNLPSDNGGSHFDLSEPAFIQVADRQAGNIAIQYRRVSCHKEGGIRFTVTGNPYYNMVLVWNVAGAGDIHSVKVKGSKKLKWTELRRDWGQNWVTNAMMAGESLTFRVTASDGRTSTSWHIAPRTWQFGQTFEGKNFK